MQSCIRVWVVIVCLTGTYAQPVPSAPPPVATPVAPSAAPPAATPVAPSVAPPAATPVAPSAAPPAATPVAPSAAPPAATPVAPSVAPPAATPVAPSAAPPAATPVVPSSVPVTTTTARTWPKPDCGNPRLSNMERAMFLDMHNNYRGNLVRGQTQVNAEWGIAPPATVIYRMKYDCAAESYAQQAVSSCRQTPLPVHALGGHKQNIRVVPSSTTRVGAIQNAIYTWWTQISRHGFRSNMLYLPGDSSRARPISSWSKMAWWNNLRLGCAIQHCGPVYVVSCMYSPGGNYDYAHVYRVGPVCSECVTGCDSQFLCRW